ncbi:MAG: prepilin-type N-terminal cleavage/methylation domain-containing protein [Bacteroidota bacterium]
MKGFTLIETLMAITLTAILSIVALYAYQLILKQYRLYDQINEELYHYQHFSALIRHQAREARYMQRYQNQLRFDFGEYSTTFDFEDKQVLRVHSLQPTLVDTLPVNAYLVSSAYEQERQDFGLIDYCSIQLRAFEETQALSIRKRYGAEELMNYQE